MVYLGGCVCPAFMAVRKNPAAESAMSAGQRAITQPRITRGELPDFCLRGIPGQKRMETKTVDEKDIILFDGSMGTYMSATFGTDPDRCEEQNLTHPQFVEQVHREYIQSGAQAIKTNTFAANTAAMHTDLAHVEEVIDAACRNAREAARGTGVRIFASIGPIAMRFAESEYEAIIDRFLRNGISEFLFETHPDPEIFAHVARYIKTRLPRAFVICEGSVGPDGYSRSGFSAQQFVDTAREVPEIDVIGFNCSCGPADMKRILEDVVFYGRRVSIMPNAGLPDQESGRNVYNTDPEYFAAQIVEIAKLGASYVGGCCGTTPEHIRAARELLSQGVKSRKPLQVVARPSQRGGLDDEEWPVFEAVSGPFVAVELDSPLKANEEYQFYESALNIADAGADLLTIADCPVGRARADSSLLASILKYRYGIETMPHLTCRDRNLNASKALLLGLHMAEVENVLLITGDPLPHGEQEVKSVFNFNSVNYAAYVRSLNETIFEGKPFNITGGLNVNAANFNAELAKAQRKVNAGMRGMLTQPVMSERARENLHQARETLKIPILAGVMPIVSYRNACFVNNELPGIEVPQKLMDKLKDKDREACGEIALEAAVDYADKLKDYADGYYVVTTLRRSDISCEIVKEIKK